MSSTLPKTKDVLVQQLLLKVSFNYPHHAKELTKKLTSGKSNSEIIQLLKHDDKLEEVILTLLSSSTWSSEKQELGNLLFDSVLLYEKDYASQVTGMLLELPCSFLSTLLNNKENLYFAILKARKEYVHYLQLEELGNCIYRKLSNVYPAEASDITGMLMEMEYEDLLATYNDQHLLDNRAKLALKVMQERNHLIC